MGVGLSSNQLESSPVVVRLAGGLGNQMFQYAAGLALSQRLSSQLLIDSRQYSTYTLHGFGLNSWRLSGQQASEALLKKAPLLLIRLGQKFPFLLNHKRFFREKSLAFDARWKQLSHAKWLIGYFQSEHYFKSARAAIVQEFTLRDPLPNQALLFEQAMQACQSVAVHVRRGDYVSNPETLKIHGICSPAYYQAAIQSIKKRVPGATFYVFSNDEVWAKANIDWPLNTQFVNSGSSSPAVDMALMAACKHHIIANSSYSWWGAWLAASEHGIKIAPQPWFDEPTYPEADLVPAHWERLSK